MRAVPLLAATLALLGAGSLFAGPSFAQTQCIATLQENEAQVKESAPHVELLVELEGGVTCTGTIKWQTSSRTARAPGDFTGSKGELRWTTADRNGPQPIRVPIRNDNGHEPKETFVVTMTDGDPNDGIEPEESDGGGAGGPTAVITILDDDKAVSPASPKPTGTASAGSNGATATSTPTGSLTPTQTATQTKDTSPSPSNGTDLAGRVGDPEDGGGGGNGAIIAILGVVLALAGGGAWFLRRRGASSR